MTKHATFFVADGRGESTHKPPTPSCQLPLAVMRLLPPLMVVSALLGGCNTTSSLPSTGSSEPEADEAAALLLVADPATPLLVALGFPSKPLIVLLDHSECWQVWGQVYGQVPGRLSVLTSTKRFYRKGFRKNEEQRTTTTRIAVTFWTVSSVRGTFSAVPFRRYPVSYLLGGIQCWRYLLGGIESWRY